MLNANFTMEEKLLKKRWILFVFHAEDYLYFEFCLFVPYIELDNLLLVSNPYRFHNLSQKLQARTFRIPPEYVPLSFWKQRW